MLCYAFRTIEFTQLINALVNRVLQYCFVSVVIPTFKGGEMLLNTLNKILECDPPPQEIIIHVDGNDEYTESLVRNTFKEIRIVKSPINIGPGGGRNRLIEAAQNEVVASFDDDSYPVDKDYFGRLLYMFQRYPEASMVAATIYDQNQTIGEDCKNASLVAAFIGCGCAYRRTDFLQTDGYLSLPLAYGAEELDVALQLHAQGRKILQTQWLRVFHNTSYHKHKHAQINAASISNIALLAYTRYPTTRLGWAMLQVLNRVFYAIGKKRYAGIVSGLLSIPTKIWLYRSDRKPISNSVMQGYLQLRSHPISIPWRD